MSTDLEVSKPHTKYHNVFVQKSKTNHYYFHFLDILERSRLLHENLDNKKSPEDFWQVGSVGQLCLFWVQQEAPSSEEPLYTLL